MLPEIGELMLLPISDIRVKNSNQTRPSADNTPEALDALVQNIKAIGQRTAITVYKAKDSDDHYTVLDGHRRFAAMQIAGGTEIACVIKNRSADNVDVYDAVNSLQKSLSLGAVLAARIEKRKGTADEKTLKQYAAEFGRSHSALRNLMSAWTQLTGRDKELAVVEKWAESRIRECTDQYKSSKHVVEEQMEGEPSDTPDETPKVAGAAATKPAAKKPVKKGKAAVVYDEEILVCVNSVTYQFTVTSRHEPWKDPAAFLQALVDADIGLTKPVEVVEE